MTFNDDDADTFAGSDLVVGVAFPHIRAEHRLLKAYLTSCFG